MCKKCSAKHAGRNQKTKIQWPPQKELEDRVAASSFLAVARELGVSDNAVRKRVRRPTVGQ